MITKFIIPVLLYSLSALEPVISTETMELHYNKHFRSYIENLNKLVDGTSYQGMTMVQIVQNAPEGPLLNNAGQALNHTLYFTQFNPQPASPMPQSILYEAVNKEFGDFETFKEEFTKSSLSLFGSGWVWLAADKEGKLYIRQYPNGLNPVRDNLIPLLGFDLWEHAYYVDYRNKRADHVKALWQIIDWETISQRYSDRHLQW